MISLTTSLTSSVPTYHEFISMLTIVEIGLWIGIVLCDLKLTGFSDYCWWLSTDILTLFIIIIWPMHLMRWRKIRINHVIMRLIWVCIDLANLSSHFRSVLCLIQLLEADIAWNRWPSSVGYVPKVSWGRSCRYTCWNCEETTLLILFFNHLSLLLRVLWLCHHSILAERWRSFTLLLVSRDYFIVVELRENFLAWTDVTPAQIHTSVLLHSHVEVVTWSIARIVYCHRASTAEHIRCASTACSQVGMAG